MTITGRGALQAAVRAVQSAIYPDRYLPDKAIDLIDEAGSRVCASVRLTAPPDLKELEDEDRQRLPQEKDEAIKGQDFEKAAELRDERGEAAKPIGSSKEDSWRDERVRRQARCVSPRTSSPRSLSPAGPVFRLLKLTEDEGQASAAPGG